MKAEKTAVQYEVGEVVRLYGRYAMVAVRYSFNCDGDCDQCREVCKKTTQIYRVANSLQAKPGERVLLAMPNRAAFMMAMLFYVIPCFLLLAVFSFIELFLSALWYLTIGISLCFFVFLFLKIVNNVVRKSGKCQISMVKILPYTPNRKEEKHDKYMA